MPNAARGGPRHDGVRTRLFVMMVLQLAVWGAWAPKLFPTWACWASRPGSSRWSAAAWGIAAVVGIFFSNQFADRNFAAERFLAVSHLMGGLALVGCAFVDQLLAVLRLLPGLQPGLCADAVGHQLHRLRQPEATRPASSARCAWAARWAGCWSAGPSSSCWAPTPRPSRCAGSSWSAAIVSFALAAYSLTLPHTPPKKDAPASTSWPGARRCKLLGVPFVAGAVPGHLHR